MGASRGSGGNQGDPGNAGDQGSQQPNNNNTPAGETPGGSNTGFHADDFNPQVAQELIERLRNNEKELQKALGERDAQLKEIQEAEMGEAEKLANRNTELEAENMKLRQKVREAQVRLQAGALGIVNPKAQEATVGLLDWEKLGDDPDPKKVDEQLKALITEWPGLKGEGSNQGPKVSPTNAGRAAGGQKDLGSWLGGILTNSNS